MQEIVINKKGMVKMKKIIYGALLLIGIIAGIYGIGYDLEMLKVIGATLVICLPCAIVVVQHILRELNDYSP